MAMSLEEMQVAEDSKRILESFINEDETVKVTEEASGKMVDLAEIELFLSDKDLSYLGSEEFKSVEGNVNVSIYLMSTKNVTVPKAKNLIDLGFEFYESYGKSLNIRSGGTNATLENFIELPKANHGEDKMSAKDVVKLCDASQIYNLYQDLALAIIRKNFTYAYHMFSGPNLYKKEEPYEGNTLYVMYDKVRKKFKYSYNPKFILECAIEEWMLQRSRYRSFKDCYTYILAFMITHEMMHIIHHSTLSDGESGDITNAGDHDIANQIQDSFINCKISRRYIGVEGIRKDRNGLAPMPKLGIGSKITVRGEHNNGFKKYENVTELSSELVKVFINLLKLDESEWSINHRENNYEIGDLAGADVFVTVDVSPTFSPIRDTGSNMFQRALDDIIKVITDGKVHSKFSKISDAEKISDLDVIPDGTLVMVKGRRDICHVAGYDEEKNEYDLTKAIVTGVRKIKTGNVTLCVTEYGKSDVNYGKRHRIQIKPYDPMDDAYTDEERPKKDRLSPEELSKVKQDQLGQQQPQPPQGGAGGMPPQQNLKNLHVGDIVWIRKLKKFGRIVSVDNGKFQLEEVIEKPAKVIDDSINY
jgi:hypothetical protein